MSSEATVLIPFDVWQELLDTVERVGVCALQMEQPSVALTVSLLDLRDALLKTADKIDVRITQ